MKKLAAAALADKKVRFLMVGVLNTAVGYGLYALFIFAGLHYFLAQLWSSILAIAHSYLWNKYYTFRSAGRHLPELIRFVSVYMVSYLLNMGLLYVMVGRMKFNAYAAGAIGLFVTTVVSYVGHKNVSFGKFGKQTENGDEGKGI